MKPVGSDIFEARADDGIEVVNVCDPDDGEVFLRFEGVAIGSRWRPVEVRIAREDERTALRSVDFPFFGSHALMMKSRAAEALRDVLEGHGELLPLEVEDRSCELFVLNAHVCDALDEERSTIWRFPSTGRVMRIKKPVFIEERVRGVELFRVPHRAMPTYVSGRFVERVRSAGLTGLRFEKVWSASN